MDLHKIYNYMFLSQGAYCSDMQTVNNNIETVIFILYSLVQGAEKINTNSPLGFIQTHMKAANMIFCITLEDSSRVVPFHSHCSSGLRPCEGSRDPHSRTTDEQVYNTTVSLVEFPAASLNILICGFQ